MDVNETYETRSSLSQWINITSMNDTTWPSPPTERQWRSVIITIYQVLSVIIVLAIMVAMGCVITINEIIVVFKSPKGPIIGMVCQFVIMPLIGLAYAFALSLDHLQALSLLLVATSPGGTTSNIFSYYLDGNVALRYRA